MTKDDLYMFIVEYGNSKLLQGMSLIKSEQDLYFSDAQQRLDVIKKEIERLYHEQDKGN